MNIYFLINFGWLLNNKTTTANTGAESREKYPDRITVGEIQMDLPVKISALNRFPYKTNGE